jgi:hypothetical protein
MRGARSANRFGLALVALAGLGVGCVVASRRHVLCAPSVLVGLGVSVADVLAVDGVVKWEPLPTITVLSPHPSQFIHEEEGIGLPESDFDEVVEPALPLDSSYNFLESGGTYLHPLVDTNR